MKAFQITDGAEIKPLPFQSAYRKGDAPAEGFRRQAAGEIPRVVTDLRPVRFIRTIALRDGSFGGLASDTGLLLTFVISGELTLATAGSQKTILSPGDMLEIDDKTISRVGVEARGGCRLIQIGVYPGWPGPEAKIQDPGTLTPRNAGGVTIKRLDTGTDGRSYYKDFSDLFSTPQNEWSAPRPVDGLRFMSWEDGFIDWHPEVVNNFAVIMSGELEIEASGDHVAHVYHAGDILLAADRTGVGHVNRCRGLMHGALMVIDTRNLW